MRPLRIANTRIPPLTRLRDKMEDLDTEIRNMPHDAHECSYGSLSVEDAVNRPSGLFQTTIEDLRSAH